MWSISPAAAILLAQAQPDLAEKWCFERGQHGAQLCEDTETACNDLLKINPEIATGPPTRPADRTIRFDGTLKLRTQLPFLKLRTPALAGKKGRPGSYRPFEFGERTISLAPQSCVVAITATCPEEIRVNRPQT
jgi:hypothetical protein